MRIARSSALPAQILALMLMAGCSAPPPPSAPPTPRPPAAGDVAARLTRNVWKISSEGNRAPGSVYVFLPDGTLMMTSCVEVYRLAQWRLNPSGSLTITEDAAVTYDADVLELRDDALALRLHLKTERVTLPFTPSPVPYVCADLRR